MRQCSRSPEQDVDVNRETSVQIKNLRSERAGEEDVRPGQFSEVCGGVGHCERVRVEMYRRCETE